MSLQAIDISKEGPLDVVMAKARNAARAWRKLPAKARASALFGLQRAVVKHMDELIDVIGEDTRQPKMDALVTEVQPVLEALKYYRRHAASILKPQRRHTPLIMQPGSSRLEYQPYGVVLVIAPWNFPFQLGVVPSLCALFAGNAVILKPSERLVGIHELTRRIIDDSGLPEGLFQVVTGGAEVGAGLIEERPDKIFFTGGTVAGTRVATQAASHLIPCDLELSGKDPMIVFRDANLRRAARAAIWGGFFHTGQVCVSTERLYVEESIAKPFFDLLVEEAKQLTQRSDGHGDIGVMTVPEGYTQVKRQLDDAVASGAHILHGGLSEGAEPPVFPPTILTHVTHDMRVMREETFGPLLPVMTFHSEQEAIRLANDSPFGLNASIFTADLHKARRVGQQLETGCLFINDVVRNITNMDLPFGGVKASGQGRYRGPEGLRAFVQTKAVMTSRGRRTSEINWFPYRQGAIDGLKRVFRMMYKR